MERQAVAFRFKKWSRTELNNLAKGIRQQNQRMIFNKLLADFENQLITSDEFQLEQEKIRRLPNFETLYPEKEANSNKETNENPIENDDNFPESEYFDKSTFWNFVDIDWEDIAKSHVPSRSAMDCRHVFEAAEYKY